MRHDLSSVFLAVGLIACSVPEGSTGGTGPVQGDAASEVAQGLECGQTYECEQWCMCQPDPWVGLWCSANTPADCKPCCLKWGRCAREVYTNCTKPTKGKPVVCAQVGQCLEP